MFMHVQRAAVRRAYEAFITPCAKEIGSDQMAEMAFHTVQHGGVRHLLLNELRDGINVIKGVSRNSTVLWSQQKAVHSY